MMTLILGVAVLTTAGCLGGSKNFASGGEPASGSSGQSIGGLVGSPAPDFTLQSIDGSKVQLADLRGKPLLINFWATWCPPCKEEMPTLQSAYQKYKEQGFEFVGVDLKEDEATVRQFVEAGGYGWKFLLDTSGQVSNSYRVSGVPTTYFVDREGVVRDMFIGPIPNAILERKLDALKK